MPRMQGEDDGDGVAGWLGVPLGVVAGGLDGG
jgi:hypothetical protein